MKKPRLIQNSKTLLATVALTGLLAGSAARLHAAGNSTGSTLLTADKGQLVADSATGKHDCKGMNACKGQGGCKTAANSCKGQNSCKGKGGCNTNTPT